MRFLKILIAILGSMMQQVHAAAQITDYGIAPPYKNIHKPIISL